MLSDIHIFAVATLATFTQSAYDSEKISPFPSAGKAMERTSKLVGRPAVRCIACRRCGMEVEVQGGASSVTLHYDLDVWRQSKCCCLHLDGPASCCSFLELERAVYSLPLVMSHFRRHPDSQACCDMTPLHPCGGVTRVKVGT